MKEIVVTKVSDYVLCSIVYCKKFFFLGNMRFDVVEEKIKKEIV